MASCSSTSRRHLPRPTAAVSIPAAGTSSLATAADHPGELRVEVADLGYTASTAQLMMPETTTLFDTPRRPSGFVHGGNSLQERAIPVLTVMHKAAAGGGTRQYAIVARAGEDVAGMHCLTARIEVVAQQALDFGGPGRLPLVLRVAEADVQAAAGIQLELCQARNGARLAAGGVDAPVGESFEISSGWSALPMHGCEWSWRILEMRPRWPREGLKSDTRWRSLPGWSPLSRLPQSRSPVSHRSRSGWPRLKTWERGACSRTSPSTAW